ncbi:14299_t:CDS:2, partial [Rhizophagus irregularis]
DNNIKQQHKELVYQIEENELEKGPRLSFQHLANFRQTPNIVQPRGPKQKYGFGMGYAKKALDLAIWADKVDEFVNQIEYFIEIRHKGRQPNRYKSCGEPQKKKVRRIQDITNTTTNKNHKEDVVASQEGKKKERRCKNCNQVGHYAPRCPNI